MGFFDGWGETIKDVAVKSVTQGSLPARQAIKRGAQNTIGDLTGVVGNVNPQQQSQSVDANGVARRPEAGVVTQQVNQETQRFMQQFGQPGANGQGQQRPGLVDALIAAPGQILKSILPQKGGALDRAVEGAKNSEIAKGINAALQPAPQNHAPIEDKSTYSAELIAQKKAAGIDTRNLRQTPEDKPVAVAYAVATPVAEASPELTAVTKPLPVSQIESKQAAATFAKIPNTVIPNVKDQPYDPFALLEASITPSVLLKPNFEKVASPAVATPAPAIDVAKPGQTTALDSLIENATDKGRRETLERARQYVSGGPGAGPG